MALSLPEKKMDVKERKIRFADEELTLTNRRTLYWERKNSLILSDLHLGKAAHFRKNGIALPAQSAIRDLLQLEHLLLHYRPGQMFVVGDLIHAGANREVDLFKDLTVKFPDTEFILIKGNHDRFSERRLKEMGIHEVHTALEISRITLSHEPLQGNRGSQINGHVHPGIRIKMPIRGFIRFPCFVVTENGMILPAFSQFTGLDTKNVFGTATYYAVADEGIFEFS